MASKSRVPWQGRVASSRPFPGWVPFWHPFHKYLILLCPFERLLGSFWSPNVPRAMCNAPFWTDLYHPKPPQKIPKSLSRFDCKWTDTHAPDCLDSAGMNKSKHWNWEGRRGNANLNARTQTLGKISYFSLQRELHGATKWSSYSSLQPAMADLSVLQGFIFIDFGA